MFALIAAILFVIGAVITVNDSDIGNPTFWVLLALAFWALHFAYTVALPAVRRRA